MANLPEHRQNILRKDLQANLDTLLDFVIFFERYRGVTHPPTDKDSLRLLFDYIEALYLLKRYQSFLTVCDQFIECSIEQNFSVVRGRDLFVDCLFMKAKVFLNLYQYNDATHIAENLRRINIHNKQYLNLLVRCYHRITPKYVSRFRGLFILTTLLSAIIVAIELFWIRIHVQDMVMPVESLRNVLFISGTFIWFLSETIHLFRSYYRALNHGH